MLEIGRRRGDRLLKALHEVGARKLAIIDAPHLAFVALPHCEAGQHARLQPTRALVPAQQLGFVERLAAQVLLRLGQSLGLEFFHRLLVNGLGGGGTPPEHRAHFL